MNDIAFGVALMDARPALVRFGLKLCFDRERAEDLASETVAKAFAARASFEPGTSLRGWLFVILRNVFLTEQRRKRFDGGYVEDLALPDRGGPASQEDHIHLRDLDEAMALIPAEYRDAVIAVALVGDYEDAAVAMGVEIGTIKSRVGRGRKMLRELSA